ncbi:MAG: arsenate reductase ArsC [Candidatus Thermoplasmatota archaeon]|nr:arsenate reductase ArsC [Candidatus Thermoplasmatota archaeon]
MKTILFICTHNSARSQMAEGLINALYGGKFKAFSAGTNPIGVNPHAIRAMAEIGIDISGHHSKRLTEFLGKKIDYVITVCDSANESCPVFPGAANRLHWSFPDPSAVKGSETAKMDAFRKVRDDIKSKIGEFFGKS